MEIFKGQRSFESRPSKSSEPRKEQHGWNAGIEDWRLFGIIFSLSFFSRQDIYGKWFRKEMTK